jgi:AraC-like DNA-binding protein
MVVSKQSGAVVFAHGALQIINYMETEGLPWKEAAIKAGLPAEKPDPETHMPLECVVALCEIGAELAGDDAFGAKAGVASPIGLGAVFEYVALAAPTLGDALRNWQRFQNVPSNAVPVRFEQEEDWAFLSWEISDSFGPHSQLSDAILGYAYSRLRHMIADEHVPIKIQLRHSKPKASADLYRLFGPDLEFDCEKERIGLPAAVLNKRPKNGEQYLLRIIEQTAEHVLKKHAAKNDQIYRIRNQISTSLKYGNASIDDVARELGMSRRALQRALEAAGTNYRQLTEDVRRALAERYLKEANLSISDIAFLLGYADLSAFSRAAKGWFGVSPRAMRERSRSNPAGA